MRVTAALLATSLLAGGCTARASYVAGGAMLAGGLLVGIGSSEMDCDQGGAAGFGCGIGKGEGIAAGLLLGSVGAALLVAGLVKSSQEAELQAKYDAIAAPAAFQPPGEAPPTDTVFVPPPQTADPELRRLTLQARTAARRHQCDAVFAVDARVRERDATFYRQQFASDAPTAACLAAK